MLKDKTNQSQTAFAADAWLSHSVCSNKAAFPKSIRSINHCHIITLHYISLLLYIKLILKNASRFLHKYEAAIIIRNVS